MEEERDEEALVASCARYKPIRKATRNGHESNNLNTRDGNNAI